MNAHTSRIASSPEKAYAEIVRHYEHCLAEHGDTHLGVDWPKQEDVDTRNRVMLEVMPLGPQQRVRSSLLDFGCGASHLLEYMRREGLDDIVYTGLDISERFIEVSREKFPDVEYLCMDVLQSDVVLPEYDYVVMNGVFTVKRGVPFDAMWNYVQDVLRTVFPRARSGLAFNVMSEHVDWKRDDLFHLPFDTLAAFLREEISRHFCFRQDYGLYEYTTYIYRGTG